MAVERAGLIGDIAELAAAGGGVVKVYKYHTWSALFLRACRH